MQRLMTATAVLALTASAALAQDVIRMGTEGQYPPYNFINDSGEVDGYERELGDLLCDKAGLTCEWVVNDWDSIIPNLVSGNYDTIMAGMNYTEERDEVIDFTQHYIPPTPSAYAALSDGVDLESGVIAAQTATIQSGYVAESGATLVEFPTPDDTIAAVRNGEADAVLADKDFLAPIVAESGGELMFAGDDVSIGGGVSLGVRESDDELQATFDAAIAELKADGTINELLLKWFGDESATYE